MDAHAAIGLTNIAFVALGALGLGLAMRRLRQPPIIGYIIAGVALGPAGLGLVEDTAAIHLLAEMGVLLLLFLIGLELNLRLFTKLWRITVVTMLAQIALSGAAMWVLGQVLGWSGGLVLVMGFAVALSSTAVAFAILENSGTLSSKAGRIAVGVLIAQDLAVVPLLVIVGSLGGEGGIGAGLIIKLLLAVGFLIFLILRLRKKRLELPFQLARGSVELLTLTGLGCCFAAAALAGLLGLSAGFGAFLAGLVIGNSTDREPIMHACHPIQALLLMIFFLSVGLLLDMGYLIDNLPAVLALLCVVTVFKTALNLIILRLMGRPWPEAATASLVLAQIGEFSFLLAITGLGAGVLTNGEDKLIIAVTVLSLALSPLWVMAARRLHGLARPGMLTLGQTARMALEAETAIMDMRFHEAGLFLGFWRRRLIETATETWATLRERLR